MKVIFERILKEMRLSTQEKITGDVFCRLFFMRKEGILVVKGDRLKKLLR